MRDQFSAEADGKSVFTVQDTALPRGAIALIDTEGRTALSNVPIEPAE